MQVSGDGGVSPAAGLGVWGRRPQAPGGGGRPVLRQLEPSPRGRAAGCLATEISGRGGAWTPRAGGSCDWGGVEIWCRRGGRSPGP